ncbi:hypothetical protein [Methylobacterium durans]|uniref:hypothetical protein n=1 Tax=Methylobacterium durans TaxID=2202825 RepID=UPI0013A575B7|nr:hypothetical protein [Methylobacterium durans]
MATLKALFQKQLFHSCIQIITAVFEHFTLRMLGASTPGRQRNRVVNSAFGYGS